MARLWKELITAIRTTRLYVVIVALSIASLGLAVTACSSSYHVEHEGQVLFVTLPHGLSQTLHEYGRASSGDCSVDNAVTSVDKKAVNPENFDNYVWAVAILSQRLPVGGTGTRDLLVRLTRDGEVVRSSARFSALIVRGGFAPSGQADVLADSKTDCVELDIDPHDLDPGRYHVEVSGRDGVTSAGDLEVR